MSSAADYAISNGLDPFIGSDWLPRDNDLDYSDDQPSTPISKKIPVIKSKKIDNFKEALAFSKLKAPSSLKTEGKYYIVEYKE